MKDGDTIMRVIAGAGLSGAVKPRYATMTMPDGRVRVSLGVEPEQRAQVAALVGDMAREVGADVRVDQSDGHFHVDILRG